MSGLITLDNVTKFYSVRGCRKLVLDNVTISMPFGKSVGILGRNGAGKSTTLMLIGKVLRPSKGRVGWAPGILMSWPMGPAGLIGTLNVRENIQIISRIYGRDWRELYERVERFADIGSDIELPVASYSSGVRSRFNLALSIAMDFDCYLCDEMMAFGDAQFRARAEAEITKIQQHSTFVIISHRMKTIEKFCQCVYVLDNKKFEYYDDVWEGIKRYESL
ncbi:MAG: ATP-binding cassette domain-containing protein [Rhodospirillales bacterium]|nr:ATP-binding cassette domain-containing protein [Rhodospirillales bacterium]